MLTTIHLRGHAPALCFGLTALFSFGWMQGAPGLRRLFFEGGPAVLITNVCEVILAPYLALFMIALGVLVFPRPQTIKALDLQVVRFFAGAGLLILFGFGLGFLKLLYPVVTIPIFIVVLYLFFLRFPDTFGHILRWFFALDAPSN